MDNWILKGVKLLENEHTSVNVSAPTQVKVKVTHLLLTDFDALLYNGKIEADYPKTLGRAAVGIVTEAGESCYGVEKGMRVYFKPTRPCGECLACKSGNPKECSSIIHAGKDFDGFMRDFAICEYNEVAPLPDVVGDFHALCIETVGIAENIYDKLKLSAGQRVAIVGASLTGNIIAQVLLYHKVIPIVIDNTPANLERAKKCGIYYAFPATDDLADKVSSATGGRLCDAAVYCSSSRLPVSLCSRLVAEGKTVVLSVLSGSGASIDVHEIIGKNITVFGVSNAYDYEDAVINMLVHNAVNTDFFDKQVLTEYDPATLLDEDGDFVNQPRSGKMTVLKMIL